MLVDDYDIGEEDIHNPIGQSDISIVPVITGAGGGLGKIFIRSIIDWISFCSVSTRSWFFRWFYFAFTLQVSWSYLKLHLV